MRLRQEVQALPRRAFGRRVTIRVVAAALYDPEGRVLIAERPAGKHMAGRWEFPGGKIGEGESERAALDRELAEELGVRVLAARPFMRLAHDYGDRRVELAMWIVERHDGTVRSLDGQRLRWVAPSALASEDILEADRPFIAALQGLPAPSR
ncbi:MAG TPA: (deoxy)nucleoside triphosphate pyrophosphohydrolase [Steroidobacteraceae bacterium]|nr:(deoxy)nucleoside triphosphate pyrophosphohydrolase [Steroidobacteraceae bacterium]